MIVFASTLRITRRPRRIPSVASVVRVLGTVRVTDQPVAWPTCPAPAAPHASVGTVTYIHRRRGQAGAESRSS